MNEFIILTFAASLLLYGVLGGADFGAGMVEYFIAKVRRRSHEPLVSHALAPVWEANHVWLILAVVILFSAFPGAYAEISTVFHLPLSLMLFAIVLRGSAFVFRHYDPLPHRHMQTYSVIFFLSSFLAPFAQGLVVGGCILGAIPEARIDFFAVYLSPWWNLFSVSVGIFLMCLYFFLGAVFLIGETSDVEEQRLFKRCAFFGSLAFLLSGALVLLNDHNRGRSVGELMIGEGSVAVVGVGLILLALLWTAISREKFLAARYIAGAVVGAVIAGWYWTSFPYMVGAYETSTMRINLYEALAPDATLRQLTIALVVGLLCIAPFFAYLVRTFKTEVGSGER